MPDVHQSDSSSDDLLKQIKPVLAEVASQDRFRLNKKIHAIESRLRAGKPVSKDLARLQLAVQESIAWVEQRRTSIPCISYPRALPVSAEVDQIKELISNHQVLIVAGETGSGKTTQIPKICLDMGIGARGRIGHTQPRRVATRTVASRIAEEVNSSLGAIVGYQVRFTDKSTDNTVVKLMTDGILLSEIQRDPLLNNYECIIVDEAHERSLNIDFLLGYLKQLLPRRPDLKLIITSATIDVERFSRHFNDAPVIEVSGRTYPVEIFYRPWNESNESNKGREDDRGYDSPIDALVAEVGHIIDTEPVSSQANDILVFLAGERDIREAALALRRAQYRNLEILPLYSRLSVSDQDRIFKPGRGRRVVLATNVAETSLTVPGIGYVIDTGTARISRYSVRTKVQRLPIEPVSQASANQRAGRCGRVAEGVCIRLYSEEDFSGRQEFTDPEILRTNLASVILQMQHLRLGNISDFPFVEAPTDKQIRDGFRLLEELSLVDDRGRMTKTGRAVIGLPVDPRFARILWQAKVDGCLKEIITVVSALSIQDPRERPADKKQQADEKHRAFMDPDSDFNAILNLWNAYQEKRQELSNRKLDVWCRSMFLSPLRMREWREIHHQLTILARDRKWRINEADASYKVMHRALLSGLITQVGVQQENKEFMGARNRVFKVFPGSCLSKKPPKWVFAAQMLDTSQLFAHQVAKFNSDWLLGLADHLLQKDYYEPYYHSRRGEIMARMRYSLYGLVVSDHHKISYKSIDPAFCRELFIREALCNWKYRGPAARKKSGFYQHNRSLCERLQDLEDRTRSRDLAVDEQQLFEFYDEKLPDTVIDQASFERWRKEKESGESAYLFLDEEQLLSRVSHEKLVEFPDVLQWQGLDFKLSYTFAPGSPEDGVTMHIPVDVLHQVPEYLPEWLVPGLLKDKLIVMFKGLPKSYRRNLVPIPAHVERILPRLKAENKPLAQVLEHELKRSTGKTIPEDAWQDFVPDDFYRMRFSLENSEFKVLGASRDLNDLRQRYRQQASKAVSDAASEVPEFPDSKDWVFGEIPEYLDIKRGKNRVRLWPGLVDKGELAGYRLFDDPCEASTSHRQGLERLVLLQQAQSVKYLNKELFKKSDLKLMSFNQVSVADLKADILLSVARDLVSSTQEAARIRTAEGLEILIEASRGMLVKMAIERESLALKWADQLRALRSRLSDLDNKAYGDSVQDIQWQLGRLFGAGFFYATPASWLPHIERFLKGIDQRMNRMQGQLNRDMEQIPEVRTYEDACENLLNEIPEHRRHESTELVELRWMLEEYRVSLFSQPMKTSRPVSSKRLAALLEATRESTKLLRG